MKLSGEKEFDKVLSVFKEVYHEKEKLYVSDNWQANVMRLIRKNATDHYQISFFDIFQQFVWRIVPVSCVLVLLLSFLMSQNDVLSDYKMVKIFINDPSDLSFLSLYNG